MRSVSGPTGSSPRSTRSTTTTTPGLKESFDLAPIYEEFADLTTLEQAQAIGASVDGDRHVRELWRFACEGYLGNLTKVQEEQVAELEAKLEVTVDGEAIGFRTSAPGSRTSPTAASASGSSSRGTRATRSTSPRSTSRRHARAGGSARARRRQLRRPLPALRPRARRARGAVPRAARRHRGALRDRRRQAVPQGRRDGARGGGALGRLRVLRATAWDSGFPADRMLPALEATLSGLGVDLGSQANVHLDLEDRKLKSPRAFCSPIEVPGKVMLVIKPMGGLDDWRALLHEAGHTEHFAHTRRVSPSSTAGSATTRSPRGTRCSSTTSPPTPSGSTGGWTSPPGRARRDLSIFSGSCTAMPPSSSTSSSSTPPPTLPRCARATSSCSATRSRSSRAPPLPRGHRLRLLRLVLPALVGVRGTAARPPVRALRRGVVLEARGGLAPARAVVARPERDGRGAAEGRHGRHARHGRGRRARPRAARLVPLPSNAV